MERGMRECASSVSSFPTRILRWRMACHFSVRFDTMTAAHLPLVMGRIDLLLLYDTTTYSK